MMLRTSMLHCGNAARQVVVRNCHHVAPIASIGPSMDVHARRKAFYSSSSSSFLWMYRHLPMHCHFWFCGTTWAGFLHAFPMAVRGRSKAFHGVVGAV